MEIRRKKAIEKQNKLVQSKENIKDLFIHSELDTEQYHKERDKILIDYKAVEKEINDLNKEIKGSVDVNKYITGLKIVRDIASGNLLPKIFDDRQNFKILLNFIVDEIIIHSRPRNEKDNIAWRKKETQFIPTYVSIKLKLPQEFLQEIWRQIKNNEKKDKSDNDNDNSANISRKRANDGSVVMKAINLFKTELSLIKENLWFTCNSTLFTIN